MQTTREKQYWAQKCEKLLLAQETVNEEKDVKIGRLQELMSSHTQITIVTAGKLLSEDNKAMKFIIRTRSSIQGHQLSLSKVATLNLDLMIGCLYWNKQPIGMAGWWQNLIQLAGYLCGKAACEYSLLFSEEKRLFSTPVQHFETS